MAGLVPDVNAPSSALRGMQGALLMVLLNGTYLVGQDMINSRRSSGPHDKIRNLLLGWVAVDELGDCLAYTVEVLRKANVVHLLRDRTLPHQRIG